MYDVDKCQTLNQTKMHANKVSYFLKSSAIVLLVYIK